MASYSAMEDKVRVLSAPATYGDTASVQVIQTHFAWVFLTAQHVYKLKKPISVSHLDPHRAEGRLKNCEEQVRLNGRLAPGIYLDLVQLVRTNDGALHLGGEGEVVDVVVRMRRLRSDLMLDACVANHCVPTSGIIAFAHVLTEFYRTQPRISFSPTEYVQRLEQQLASNEQELLNPALGLRSKLVQRAIQRQRRSLDAVREECGTRGSHHVIEVHGDLKPEHIYLGHPPCVIDRLDLSADLRTMDPYEELAYFQIECRLLGALWIGELVRQTYAEQASDHVSSRLYHFYQGQRALTRARIVASHVLDPEVAAIRPWREMAADYLSFAAVVA